MVLAILDHGDTSHAFQREIQGRVREWESLKDSRNGDWGPSAMALALDAYGAKGYEVRAYKTRQGALRGAAKAIMKTNSPVILLAWRGAHTWVMTGFKADADPTVFSNAKISGTYILDPWYPDISSIWGPSDPPGTFQDNAGDDPQLPARGSGPKAGTRIATACTSRSSRRSRSARPADPDPPDPRRQEERQQDVLDDHPGRVAERDAEDPELRDEERRGEDDRAEPGERGDDLAERVVRRVQPARQRVGERIERDREGEGGDDRRRRPRRPRR